MTAETATHTHRGTWRDVVIPWGDLAYPLAIVGIPLAYVSPVIIVILLVLAMKRGQAYLVLATIETMLMLVHFFAILPSVQ